MSEDEVKENAPVVTEQNVPTALLELLVYGIEAEKEHIAEINRNLLKQIERKNAAHLVRIFFFLSNEKNETELQQACLEKSHCRYYIFINTSTNLRDLVKEALIVIKRLDSTITEMKRQGITVFRAPQAIENNSENNSSEKSE